MSLASDLEATPAPDFTMPDIEGHSISLTQLRGLPVVLSFFTENCAWCRTEMPRLAEIYRRVAKVKAHVIGIMAGCDDDEAAANFASEYQLSCPIVLDREGSMVASFHITRVPSVVLLDEAGTIVRVYEGATEQLSGIVEQSILAAAGRQPLPTYSLVGNGCAPN
jgi:peroxiredoxin